MVKQIAKHMIKKAVEQYVYKTQENYGITVNANNHYNRIYADFLLA